MFNFSHWFSSSLFFEMLGHVSNSYVSLSAHKGPRTKKGTTQHCAPHRDQIVRELLEGSAFVSDASIALEKSELSFFNGQLK